MSHPWADRIARLGGVVADGARAAAGRADYARGLVEPVTVAPGVLEGRVTSDAEGVCSVRIVAPPPGDDEWRAAVQAILARPAVESKVVGGELPVELAGVFAAAGVPLVPGAEELDTSCSCANDDGGCRHIVGVLLGLAAQTAAAPKTLLAWRGRTPETLAEAVKSAGGLTSALLAAASAPDEHERALPLDEAFWTGWPVPEPPLASADAPGDAVLDELGPPPEDAGGAASLDRLRELYEGFRRR